MPTIVYADIIIPGFRNNRVSVDFIVQHIKNMARRITFKERAVKTKTFILLKGLKRIMKNQELDI